MIFLCPNSPFFLSKYLMSLHYTIVQILFKVVMLSALISLEIFKENEIFILKNYLRLNYYHYILKIN